MTTRTISIARDFSAYPGGRFLDDGPFSGERFREEILVPALKKFQKIVVDLDDAEGYGSSFLDEVFSGLIRHGYFTAKELRERLSFISEDSAYEKEIWNFINQAKYPSNAN